MGRSQLAWKTAVSALSHLPYHPGLSLQRGCFSQAEGIAGNQQAYFSKAPLQRRRSGLRICVKIGIMLPNWIGDVAMATPTLRALRHQFPQAKLIGVIRPYAQEVLAGTPFLDQTILWDHHGPSGAACSWRTFRTLQQERIDTWAVLRNSISSAAMARLSGGRRVVGYSYPLRRYLLTEALQPPRQNGKLVPISAVDYYLRIAEHLGCTSSSRELQLATLPHDEGLVDHIWRHHRLPEGKFTIGLNVGGAYGSAKRWPVEHATELARRLAHEQGLGVLILCGPKERDAAREMVSAAQHPLVRSLADEPISIGLIKAAVRRLRLLVTTDSGPRHLAAGLGTPTITLFGSTDPTWGENYQTQAIKLRLDMDCSPCGKRTCPLGHHRCMQDLSVDHVMRAIRDQLSTSSQPQLPQVRVA